MSVIAIRLHNTLTHGLEVLEPKEPGHVRMYVCGPSVYAESHLGHARSYVAYDGIKRVLMERGYRVTHVQNFTDVEENVTARARERGMEPLAWAEHLIGRFFEDMDRLRILRAQHYPRVSQHIAEIQRIAQALVEKKRAYTYDCAPAEAAAPAFTGASPPFCDVYFDAHVTPDYGALIGTSVEELAVELPMRGKGDRRHPLDFALWKSRDDWGVTWPSPWGEGRPGWHIECTAMATKYLGFDFDIHGGGLDLVFPHHENERVIGEAVSGERYCRYYLHNGFVTVGSTKMSKSLGNFVTVQDLLAEHDAEVLRAFLLSRHYRAPLNYDEKEIDAAEERVARWRAQLAAVERAAAGAQAAQALAAPVCDARDAFWAALEEDFHFERALDALDLALARAQALEGAQAASALAFFREAARATGLLWQLGEP